MASSDADKVLCSTRGRANFQRLSRLLVCGGTRVLRERFDFIYPPRVLPTVLRYPPRVAQLEEARLTKPQWDRLYPSPGVYGKSTDFDISLLSRLLRTICNLTPPPTGWDSLPDISDYSLAADLVRINFYRNSVYGHVKENMEVTDDDFPSLWEDISKAIVRIAGKISSAKRNKWKKAIDGFLNAPLTPEDERNVQELQDWYRKDVDVKKAVKQLKASYEERMSRVETTVKGVQEAVEAGFSSLAAAGKETKRLEETAQEKDETIRDLNENYKRLEHKCKDKERQQLKEASEMEVLKRKLEAIKQEKMKLEKELLDERKATDQKEKAFLDLQGRYSKLLDKYKKLEDEYKQLKHEHAKAIPRISEMQLQFGTHDATAPSAEGMRATSRPKSAQIRERTREEKKKIEEESDEMNELLNSAEKGRSIPKPRVFSYRSDFDEKGVIYALGTNFGENAHWVNPGGKKAPHLITVTRSSDGFGQPKDLLNYKKEAISGTKGEKGCWWCLDLGKKFCLVLAHYTLRHGRNDNKSHLKNWELQGSHDGKDWVVLDSRRKHKWYETDFEYMTKTWPIEGKVEAFRFFRIFQTGANSTGQFDIYLSGMELYGVLHNMSP